MTTITRDAWERLERLRAAGCQEVPVLIPPGLAEAVYAYIDRLTRTLVEPEAEPYGRDDLMAVAAVRYCLGRASYIVGDCCDWLVDTWPLLRPSAQTVIRRDVEEAFQHDALGMDIDRQQWERVRRLWE